MSMAGEATTGLSELIAPGTPEEVRDRYLSLAARAEGRGFGPLEEDVVVLDTETTGLSFKDCDLIEISAARMSGREVVGRFETFVHPGGPIPAEITRLTGISNRDVADAPSPRDAVAALAGAPAQGQGLLCYQLLCELAAADQAGPALPPLVAAAAAAMEENYAGLYGVEELSASLGVSKSHLVRAFKAAMGITPGQYLTGVRLEAAKLLLARREYSLEVVASLCGFSGANYLCRVFKKATGQTPTAFRAAAAGANARSLPLPREEELYV